MNYDPVIVGCLSLVALVWSMLGWFIWNQLGHDVPPGFPRLFIGTFSGPLIWAFAIYRAFGRVRVRVLTQFGVGGYSCCGTHRCGHGIGAADRIVNHPTR